MPFAEPTLTTWTITEPDVPVDVGSVAVPVEEPDVAVMS